MPNHVTVMYKTRNTGMGNGMRGTRGMGRMLYSGEYRQTFRGMSRNILGNVLKHSGGYRQTFRGMQPNIPRNVVKHSGECSQTFREMQPNIPGNVFKQSGECPIYFDCRELVQASSITVVFSGELLIVCFVIFFVEIQQSYLLPDSTAARTQSLCLEKLLKSFCWCQLPKIQCLITGEP